MAGPIRRVGVSNRLYEDVWNFGDIFPSSWKGKDGSSSTIFKNGTVIMLNCEKSIPSFIDEIWTKVLLSNFYGERIFFLSFFKRDLFGFAQMEEQIGYMIIV